MLIERYSNTFNDPKNGLSDFVATRTALLIILFIAFFVSICVLGLNLFNIINMRVINKIPWLFLVKTYFSKIIWFDKKIILLKFSKFVLIDFVFMGLTFAIGVAACVREKQLTDMPNHSTIFELAINRGGFVSAGVNDIFISISCELNY